MQLQQLLQNISYQSDLADLEITGITCDSRKVMPGNLFVCIAGANFDGHDHAKESLAAGAVAVLTERDLGISAQVLTDNTRKAYGIACANWFGNPARQMKMIGVTGTNGKTTVTSLIKQILSQTGASVGLVGTIQNEIGDRVIPTEKTTPDAYELQQLFRQMADAGCSYVVMEVSSHALDQYRVGDTRFDIAVFTNLTQDHLDYHQDMEHYFAAKTRLFEAADVGILNIDDLYGKQLSVLAPCRVIGCSLEDPQSDYFACDIECLPSGTSFRFCCDDIIGRVAFPMPGLYSVRNALSAIAVCRELGVSINQITHSLEQTSGVKGRSEVIPTGRDFTVVCDYAHTPDGLENILPSMKRVARGRLVTLFGCGGDRDKGKRPLMGHAAAKYADFVIVTSDNPRTEDPQAIIQDILPGVEAERKPYVVIPNRKEAIRYAISHAQSGDMILLAGKGHEDYQVIGKEKYPFDEREIVAEVLATLE